ncbi:MAG: hypothetical protein ACOCRK_08790 [bacterium]
MSIAINSDEIKFELLNRNSQFSDSYKTLTSASDEVIMLYDKNKLHSTVKIYTNTIETPIAIRMIVKGQTQFISHAYIDYFDNRIFLSGHFSSEIFNYIKEDDKHQYYLVKEDS